MRLIQRTVGAALVAGGVVLSAAQPAEAVKVRVKIENLSPADGVFFTPAWVGFHDGTFDTYDGGQPLSVPLGPGVMEPLVEDGATGPLMTRLPSP